MAYALGDRQKDTLRRFVSAGLVVAFICAAFAAAASLVVGVLYLRGSIAEPASFGIKVLAKAVAFSIAAVAALWLVARLSKPIAACEKGSITPRATWGFLPVALIAALLFFTNLDRHPWPAPDELHHLIVARNLAEYGAYASGLAPKLVYFDNYDSVGAPVIGTVAAAFKMFGVGIVSGRIILALYGVALVPLIYFLLLPTFGARASSLAALFALASFGTIYLSRSLYGEVPAFDFVLGGLILWRRGLNSTRVALLLAGFCFGFAVLAKAFTAAAALAVVGAYVYDRASYRRIPARGMLLPAAGTLAVLAAWQAIQYSQRNLIAEQPSMMLYYRHSLSFGFDSVVDQMPTIFAAIPVIVLGILALGSVVPRVFRDQYDPALVVLTLIAPLFAFWYVFFTPMHIPRYLWYPGVVAAICCGPLADAAFSKTRHSPTYYRLVAMPTLAALLVWIYGVPFATSTYKVFAANQAGPDQAVVRYLAGLPSNAKLATTYWPAERLVNFLLERPVTVIEPGVAQIPAYDVLIESDRAGQTVTAKEVGVERFGHYVVYRRDAAGLMASLKERE